MNEVSSGSKRDRAIRRRCRSMSAVPRKRPNRGQVANGEKGHQPTRAELRVGAVEDYDTL